MLLLTNLKKQNRSLSASLNPTFPATVPFLFPIAAKLLGGIAYVCISNFCSPFSFETSPNRFLPLSFYRSYFVKVIMTFILLSPMINSVLI